MYIGNFILCGTNKIANEQGNYCIPQRKLSLAISIKISEGRDDTVPNTVDTRRHCKEE